MSDLAGLGILVLGAGVSGCAAARLAHSRGAEVTVVDSAPRERLSADALRLESEGIALRCGELPAAWDGPEVSQVVVSPGVRLDSPPCTVWPRALARPSLASLSSAHPF